MDFESEKTAEFLRVWAPLNPRSYRPRVDGFLGFVALTGAQASPESLAEYIAERRSAGLSPSTVVGDFYAAKKFLVDLHDFEASAGRVENRELSRYTLSLGFQAIKLPRVDKGRRMLRSLTLTKAKLDEVIIKATPRTGLFIEFLVDTGLRVEELVSLRLNRCHLVKKFYQVSVIGKGDRERSIWVKASLVSRIRREFQGHTYLFETRSQRQFAQRDIRQAITLAFRNLAGISFSPHNLRHWHLSYMAKNGVSLGALCKAAGHASPETTARYYDNNTVAPEDYSLKHHGNRGCKGGNPNGRKPKNL